MNDPPNNGAPKVRCAIYTRKSTSEGLDSDFNTLDAQREAGKVDIVVVYKVDRLSRSLLDFAKLLARFETQNVGFVSTTQQFNTRDAMGRLTLNIVVSFAQFEREMIADRTRDKMGAARKRGKWLGSRPPLGYLGDRKRMRLVVVPDEADQVRTMFQLYLRLGSAAEVARRINELGWQRKTTRTRAGREVGGGAWTEKDVHMLLRNPIYLGKVDFKGECYEGEHEAIVDAPLFEQVQRTLFAKACGRGPRRGRNPEYLLQSLLHCGLCGQPMTTTAGKGRSGEVYRYYACRNRARKTEDRCEHPRLSAPEVEELVISRVRHVCADRAMREQIAARMRVAEPGMAARIQEQRAEAEQVTQTIRILEVFDEAWAAFNAADIEAGRYKDYADVARRHGLTRARLTQLMNLLLLAPDIQEEVLTLEFPAMREPITERTLRRLLESLVWEDQRALWAELRAVAG